MQKHKIDTQKSKLGIHIIADCDAIDDFKNIFNNGQTRV